MSLSPMSVRAPLCVLRGATSARLAIVGDELRDGADVRTTIILNLV